MFHYSNKTLALPYTDTYCVFILNILSKCKQRVVQVHFKTTKFLTKTAVLIWNLTKSCYYCLACDIIISVRLFLVRGQSLNTSETLQLVFEYLRDCPIVLYHFLHEVWAPFGDIFDVFAHISASSHFLEFHLYVIRSA